MGLEFAVLSSGSKANCSLVSSAEGILLIDCGLSASQVKKRLSSLGYCLEDVRGVLITHEHSDHTRGLNVLMKELKLPVYCTKATCENSPILSGLKQLEFFEVGESFQVLDMKISSISISHDAVEPVAYRIDSGSKTLCFLTDLGIYSDEIVEWLKAVDGLLIESNHDLDLLELSPYSKHLKERIRSDRGHLSNNDAASLVEQIVVNGERPKVIVAGHISENSNLPELAVESLWSGWKSGLSALEDRCLEKLPEDPEIVAASVKEATRRFVL